MRLRQILWALGGSEGLCPTAAVIPGTILLPLFHHLTLESGSQGSNPSSGVRFSAPPFPSLNRAQRFLLFTGL